MSEPMNLSVQTGGGLGDLVDDAIANMSTSMPATVGAVGGAGNPPIPTIAESVPRFDIDPATGKPKMNSKGKEKKLPGRPKKSAPSTTTPAPQIAAFAPLPMNIPAPSALPASPSMPSDPAAVRAGAENLADSILDPVDFATSKNELLKFRESDGKSEKGNIRAALVRYLIASGGGDMSPGWGLAAAGAGWAIPRVMMTEPARKLMRWVGMKIGFNPTAPDEPQTIEAPASPEMPAEIPGPRVAPNPGGD